MFLYKSRNKLKKIIIENFQYYYYFIKSQKIKSKEKRVYVDVREIELNRYLYSFIKFFLLNGYTVYLPKDKKMISVLSKKKGEFLYASWILREKVKFGRPKSPKITISRDQLSNDYFSGNKGLNEFHVPMSEYPAFYFYEVESPKVDFNKKRKNSVFMSGNIDSTYYYTISNSKIFDVLSRREVADWVMKQAYYLNVKKLIEVHDFINGDIDCKVLLIDTQEKFRIPSKELKSILVQFNFYLALPGILIPQSHNVIEAMSVGCIPVIHTNYANLFTPGLKHKENAIVYCNLKELNFHLLELFKLENIFIKSMRGNVYTYYNDFLSPKAIVNKIENNYFSKIYIQAEGKSLERIKNKS